MVDRWAHASVSERHPGGGSGASPLSPPAAHVRAPAAVHRALR